MSNAIAIKKETSEQVELTDEQLASVVGGCGGHESRYDDDCGSDSWGGYQQQSRRRRGCDNNYGWGHQSCESDYSEERHYHRSYSNCDY